MSGIVVERVTKSYARGWREPAVVALDGVSIEIGADELVAVVGPSGCGKTTLLRTIAGLERVDSGTIRLGGRDATRVAPEGRDVAMVFQAGGLAPHLSVRENLAFPLRARGVALAERERRVGGMAALLGIADLLGRPARELSGGERQRVALGRALVREPACLLLDEPFAALDAPLRRALRGELRSLHRRMSRPALHVTHDQEEAMALAHRVAVMRGGRIEQIARPEEAYASPATRFVAEFIGPRGMNMIEGRLAAEGAAWRFVAGNPAGSTAMVLSDVTSRRILEACDAGLVASIGLRPEALSVVRDGEPSGGRPRLEGVVRDVQRVGDRADVAMALASDAVRGPSGSADVLVWAHVPAVDAPDAGVRVTLAAGRLSLFDAGGRAVAHLTF